MADGRYIAGKCNIGKNEIRKRYILSVFGFILTGLLTFFIVYLNLNSIYGFLVFISLVIGFEGFYQGHFKFCAGLAAEGVYDLTGSGGTRGKVNSKKAHNLDIKSAIQIHIYSLISSLPAELAVFLIIHYV